MNHREQTKAFQADLVRIIQRYKDETKLTSAHIFKAKLDQVLADPEYLRMRKEFEEKYP